MTSRLGLGRHVDHSVIWLQRTSTLFVPLSPSIATRVLKPARPGTLIRGRGPVKRMSKIGQPLSAGRSSTVYRIVGSRGISDNKGLPRISLPDHGRAFSSGVLGGSRDDRLTELKRPDFRLTIRVDERPPPDNGRGVTVTDGVCSTSQGGTGLVSGGQDRGPDYTSILRV